ncbi:MAG: hypothetical protein GC201_15705 [Alphaproteobacteria bacterium]|nr:hypothetical protein [Alphaproteobacteria bacterium]
MSSNPPDGMPPPDKPDEYPLPEKRMVWISLPPVHEQTYQQFMNDTEGWRTLCRRVRSHLSGEKLETAERLIQDIPARMNDDCTYLIFHLHRLRGVAVVSLTEEPGSATVRYVLSDASEWGVGLTLLEAAATLSQKHGNAGRVRLIAENDHLLEYYTTRCGFRVVAATTMISGPVLELEPGASSLWTRHGNEWRLIENDLQATWR